MFLHNLLTSSEIQIVCIKILEKKSRGSRSPCY